MKRGRGSRNYGQARRAVAMTWGGLLDAANARADACARERERLLAAVSTIDTFISMCFDADTLREWRPRAAVALNELRELVENTEFE